MIGLLMMAAKLAERRARCRGHHAMILLPNGEIGVATRSWAQDHPGQVPASVEYYKIIDRISRGDHP